MRATGRDRGPARRCGTAILAALPTHGSGGRGVGRTDACMPIHDSVLDLIGNTPIIRTRRLDAGPCELFLKLESQNPGGSIKDRIGLSMIESAEKAGKIKPGENIVLVVATSSHRQAAFEAASFLMDFLKSRAPFWKKEHRVDGSEGSWVDAKESDEVASARWNRE